MAVTKTICIITSDFTINLTSTTRYAPIQGSLMRIAADTIALTEANSQFTMRAAGTFSNLYVRISTNAKAGATTVRTRKNTANGAQSVSITASTTGVFEDTTNSDSITAGDKINYSFVFPSNSGNQVFSIISMNYLASGSDTVVPLQVYLTATVNLTTTTMYQGLEGLMELVNSTEANAKTRMRAACTLRYLFSYLATNTTGTVTVKLRVNGADGNSVVSYSSATTGILEDTTHTDTIAVGDDANYSMVASTASGTRALILVGISMLSTDNKFFLGSVDNNGSDGVIAANITTYVPIGGRPYRTTTENNTKVKTRISTNLAISQLTANITANSINGTSTIRTRVSGANGAQSVSIGSSTTGLFVDSTNIDTLTSTDDINYQIVTGGTTGNMTLRQISVVGDSDSSTLFSWPISETAISVSDTLTRFKAAFRTISETAITVSQTLTRNVTRVKSESAISVSNTLALKITRAITQSTSVSDALVKIRYYFRTISESSVTVGSDTLIRLKVGVRAISEGAIVVDPSTLTRFKAAFRTIAEGAVSVSGLLVSLKKANRTITEGAISVSDSPRKSVLKFMAESAISVNAVLRLNIIRIISTEPAITVGASSLARFKKGVRNLLESSSVSDSMNRKASRIVNEPSISVSDALEGHLRVDVHINEPSITVSNTLTSLKKAFREPAEFTPPVTDSMLRKIFRFISNTVSVSDSLFKSALKFRSMTESGITVGGSTLTRFKKAVRLLIEDEIDGSDTLESSAHRVFDVNDEPPIDVNDSLFGERQKNRHITDTVIVGPDSISIQRNYFRTILEDHVSATDIINVTKISANEKHSYGFGRKYRDIITNDSRLEFPDVKDEFLDDKEQF